MDLPVFKFRLDQPANRDDFVNGMWTKNQGKLNLSPPCIG